MQHSWAISATTTTKTAKRTENERKCLTFLCCIPWSSKWVLECRASEPKSMRKLQMHLPAESYTKMKCHFNLTPNSMVCGRMFFVWWAKIATTFFGPFYVTHTHTHSLTGLQLLPCLTAHFQTNWTFCCLLASERLFVWVNIILKPA